ncbi:hypothetical protein SELMODRAFT_233268 [Selaginella moellendorffii]|uniref:Clathrin adaptor alpha/beta/gamma-adaptin appendage Ig-like subdomain domain-containing protein n=2 Tax=Selaginella moellendorffii TaxID=88036 RepID=D8S746_SELML|nr:hypothetical protein SELMODRAFT_233268 [Selaginella moellendorffii]
MAMASMRGLQMFITDVRNCQSKDQEMARVEKELNKIRMKFSYEKSLSSYEKKKYVWKLLYIHILGYQLDFGHREVLSLVGSHKYAEKQVGYMVAGCLLHENHEFLNLITKAIRLDIIGRSETYQCLALTMIGNIGGRDFAEALAPDVQKLVVSGSCRPLVRKKAILCLLHIYRKHPEVIQLDIWPDHIVNLLDERDYGVLLCVMTLLVALASNNPQQYYYCVSKCVRILERLLRSQSIPQDYTFYGIPSPWLQVKTMQALQLLPLLEDPSSVRLLLELLERVVIGTDITQSINKTNVMHAALFEAMELIMLIDTQQSLIPRCMVSLSKFVSLREPNLRCLGMRVLARLLSVADVRDNVCVYETDILFSLREEDRSIQKVSVDLLYEICDATNVKRIVEESWRYLCFSTAEFDVQESIATKAGLLAEKYATDCSWYVDVVLLLVEKGGALVPDDVWRGLIQCVAEHDDIQVYAATKAREYISKPMVHETMLKIAGSLLGDNSHLLARKPGYTPKEIFWALHDKFSNVRYGEHLEADLQQRAMGFFSLSQQDQNISNEEPKRQSDVLLQEAPVKSSRDSLPGVRYFDFLITSTARAPEVDLLGDLVAPRQNDPFQTGITKDPFSSMLAPAVQPTGNLIEWFNALCYKDTGILYEDPYVQIGIKAQYQGPRGEINFYLGNKQSETLTSVRAIILPQPHLRVEFPGAPPSIQAAEQIQVLLKVACLYAGRIAPLLDFSYMVSGMTVSVKLRIPIVISKFLQPATLSANDFFSAWRALVTAPNKLQEVIRGLQYSTVSEFSDKLNGLRIGVATGLEPNPNNLVAASSFHSETGGALLCMVRIETDPADKTQLRLTVASPNSRLALE